MTAYTQSGYPVLTDYGDPALTSNPAVPGTAGAVLIMGGLRSGDPMTCLLYVAARWHSEVEPLVQSQGQWGYTYKSITGGSGWSNHAGGVAVDLNATRHPQGAHGTVMNMTAVGQIEQAVGSALDWGGRWSGSSVDAMHWQISNGKAGDPVANLAGLIRSGKVPNVPPELRSAGGSTLPPDPPTDPGDDDVALSDDDVKRIAKAVWAYTVPRHGKIVDGAEKPVELPAGQTLADPATYAARASVR